MAGSVLEQFCTPPPTPETQFDVKATANAEILTCECDEVALTGYAWGTGRTVLLLHGWGSRASHWSPLVRILVKSGFRVIAFDAPAHGRSLKPRDRQQSSMFEFCRAMFAAAQTLQPVYALVGHSLGAASMIFANAGYADLAPYTIPAERLVAISAPESMNRMITLFCRQRSLPPDVEWELTTELEQAFEFSVAHYQTAEALAQTEAHVLLVHDEDDNEVPVSGAHQLQQARPDARLVLTRGSGHQRILGNRNMLRAVNNFLVH